jgi:hypothetical protein
VLQVIVGQEVVLGRSSSWNYQYSFGWKVSKVTPKGQIVVQKTFGASVEERRFNPEGKEMSGTWGYNQHNLHVDVEEIKARKATEDRCKTARKAIQDVKIDSIGTMADKDTLEKYVKDLEEKLAIAKAAVEAI